MLKLGLLSCRYLSRSRVKHFFKMPRHKYSIYFCTKMMNISGHFVFGVGVALTFKNATNISVVKCCSVKSSSVSDVNVDNTDSKSLQENRINLFFGQVYWTVVMLTRTATILMRFFPLLLFYPLALLIPPLRPAWWWGLLLAMETAGPSFIKLGQWASTRRDLFSEEFCERFSVFHLNVATHKWSHTEKILNESFGEDWRHVFLSLNDKSKPVGSGCVAQVYKAWMKSSTVEGTRSQNEKNKRKGRQLKTDTPIPVAVKVRHPGVEQNVARDLIIMKGMASVLSFLFPSLRWLSLTECVEEFGCLMSKQLDLVNEARCLETFHKNFSSSNSIHVPRPVWPFVTREVLVETFEEGEHLSTFIKAKNCPQKLKERLALLGVKALLKMIFVDNFIHGDLHPGNILVQNADKYLKETGLGRDTNSDFLDVTIVLLDVGITASLKLSDTYKFYEVFKAVVMEKGEKVAELFLTQSRISECYDPEVFSQEMTKLVKSLRTDAINLRKVKVGVLLSEVFGLMIKHRIKVESNFASVILALAVLEGLGRSLDPDLDILKLAKPFLIPESRTKS